MLRRLFAVALLLAVVLPQTLAAQEPSPGGQKLAVTTMRVLPADAARYEALTEQLANAAREINLDPGYGWFFWNDVFDYMLVYPFENMAYWDDPDQWARQFQGTSAETRVNELFEEFGTITSEVTASEVLETVPNWSHLPDVATSSEQFAFIEVTDIWLKSGTEMEWEALVKDWVDLLAEAEYPYPTIGYRCFFGCGSDALLVTLYDSREAFYGVNSLERLIEANGLGEAFTDIVERYVLMAARQEVSHGAARPGMGYRIVP